jgi:hypothetical protein
MLRRARQQEQTRPYRIASATEGSLESSRRKIGVLTGSSTFAPFVMNASQILFAAPKYPNLIAVPADACIYRRRVNVQNFFIVHSPVVDICKVQHRVRFGALLPKYVQTGQFSTHWNRTQSSQSRIAFFIPRQPVYRVTFGERSLRYNATDIPGASYKYPHFAPSCFSPGWTSSGLYTSSGGNNKTSLSSLTD